VRKFGIYGYACALAPCGAGASTLEIAVLSLREPDAPFYHTRVGFCKELTTWRITKQAVFSKGRLAEITSRITNAVQTPEFTTMRGDRRFVGSGPIALINIKVADSEPCSQFEKHLQKHRYELYFHFNL
jgi:hypothetical protein